VRAFNVERPHEAIAMKCPALAFTILAAVRTNEAIGAEFDEFDLTAKLWRIPGERMKAGQPHRVPLCNRAVAIVKELAETRSNEFMFPGRKRGEPLSDIAMPGHAPEHHRARLSSQLPRLGRRRDEHTP
jgi:integrase